MTKENQKYFWGIDCGSSAIKVVVCDESGRILRQKKVRTLFPIDQRVKEALNFKDGFPSPFAGDSVKENHVIAATGYGRNRVSVANHRLTEIKAHYLGASLEVSHDGPYAIIDIGGKMPRLCMLKIRPSISLF